MKLPHVDETWLGRPSLGVIDGRIRRSLFAQSSGSIQLSTAKVWGKRQELAVLRRRMLVVSILFVSTWYGVVT
jgi:hypothetical protein